MNKLVQNYIQDHKELILQQWIEKMKEKADDRVINVVSDQVFIRTSSLNNKDRSDSSLLRTNNRR